MVEADQITKENKEKKAGSAATQEAHEEFMQDAAAQRTYGTDGKKDKQRRRRGSPGKPVDLDGSDDEAPASKKKAKKVAISLADYATATGKDEDELYNECMEGKVPAGYT